MSTSVCVTVDAVKAPLLLCRCTAAGDTGAVNVAAVQRGGDDHQWCCGGPAEARQRRWLGHIPSQASAL